jgi:hypothetical protein
MFLLLLVHKFLKLNRRFTLKMDTEVCDCLLIIPLNRRHQDFTLLTSQRNLQPTLLG